MLSFYIAAKFIRRDEARRRADFLKKIGFTVTSRWVYAHTEDVDRWGKTIPYDDPRMVRFAIQDLEDVDKAECLLLLTGSRGSENVGGGRFVEMGYALAQRKRVIVVGDLEVIFCGLPQVLHFKTWEDFLVALIKGQIKPTLPDLGEYGATEKIYPNTMSIVAPTTSRK